MTRYIAHTAEGIKYFDSKMDALFETNATTNIDLFTKCGVLLGMDLSYNVTEAMITLAGCPCRELCITDAMYQVNLMRDKLNAAIK